MTSPLGENRKGLTKAEEIALWTRYHKAKTERTRRKAISLLVESVEPLIRKTAREAARRLGYEDSDNAVAEALLRCTELAHYFDPHKARFTTFAHRIARQAVSNLCATERSRDRGITYLADVAFVSDSLPKPKSNDRDREESRLHLHQISEYWLASLTDDVRAVAELTILEGVSILMASRRLGLTHKITKSRHRLALSAAKKMAYRWLMQHGMTADDLLS